MRKEKQISKYSVISTEVMIENTSDFELLVKLYKCNVQLPISLRQLKAMIDQYRTDIAEVGINTPEIIESAIVENAIMYKTKNCGANLIELGFSYETFEKFVPQIDLILNQLTIAINAQLMVDPHPKNFVFGGGAVSFVDIFPPYGVAYNQVRNSISTPAEALIVSENLRYFSPENTIAHFCGDLLDLDDRFVNYFENVYDIAKMKKSVDEDFQTFKSKAKKIRQTEDERLLRGIFLV